jgi:hypothetical protein
LDQALQLVDDELERLVSEAGACNVNPAAEGPLIRIASALDHRKSWAPDECAVPDREVGDEGKRRDHRGAPKRATAGLDIPAKERVLEMIPTGRSELRENVTRALTGRHGLHSSTAAMAIGRLVGDGKPLREVKVGKHKVLERVA